VGASQIGLASGGQDRGAAVAAKNAAVISLRRSLLGPVLWSRAQEDIMQRQKRSGQTAKQKSVMALFGVSGAIACSIVAMHPGCAEETPPPAIEPITEETTVQQGQLSESGIERVIPIHFALLKLTQGGPEVLTLEQLQLVVRQANVAFRPAGVQFYISAIEQFVTPSLFVNGWDNSVSWASVVTDIKQIFPNALTSFNTPTGNKSVMEWLDLASSNWGPKDELFISIGEGGGQVWGVMPSDGRGLAGGKGPLSDAGTFVHELGHHLGLMHTFELENPLPIDPETGTQETMNDYWDLIYGYENPPRFFANRQEAVNYSGTKLAKNHYLPNTGQCGQLKGSPPMWDPPTCDNCRQDPNTCKVTCDLQVPLAGGGTSTFAVTTGAAGQAGVGAEGISFVFPGENPPTTNGYGLNLMVYTGGCANTANRLMSFSTSQARLIRKNLRFRQAQDATSRLVVNGNVQPTYRDMLGKYAGNQSLSFRLDFDGDGRRDIAVFHPADGVPGHTGQFRIRTSSSNYAAASEIVANFGTIGDVPVPADYDGDRITDIAVWRTMGPNGDSPFDNRGFWIWCPSTINPTCNPAISPPVSMIWGQRSDIPLPGTNFDGRGVTPELAVYRPSTKTFHWAFNAVSNPVFTAANTASKTFEAIASEVIPRVGFYDSDNKTDLVVFDPATTRFDYSLSGNGFATQVLRAFNMGPANSGGPTAQRAPFPVTTYTTGCKEVFSVWNPNNYVYSTMWTPLSTNTVSTCGFGTAGDIPIGNSIDRPTFDGRSDRLIRRNELNSGAVTVHLDSAAESCFTNYGAATLSGVSQRAAVFSAQDGSGDGLPDIWWFDPDKMTWGFFKSDANFGSGQAGPYTLGQPHDLPL
jgi:hypothetical protein